MEQMYYNMTIAGCDRALPLCPLTDELMIGAFVIWIVIFATVGGICLILCDVIINSVALDINTVILIGCKGIALATRLDRTLL